MNTYDLSILKDLDFCISNINTKEKHCEPGFQLNQITGRPLHGFLYILKGQAEYTTFNNNIIIVKENDIMYLPKYCKYCSKVSATRSCSYIIVNMDIIDNNGSEIFFTNDLSIILNAGNSYYQNIFKEINNTYIIGGVSSKIKCKYLVYEMLYHLSLDLYKNELMENKFLKIYPGILFLEENYNQNITVKDLANACHLSVSHFRKLFSEYFGMSPIKYINNIRIKKACELLKSGLYTVGEASEKTGFNSVYYFSRTFKKVIGINPKEIIERISD